MELIKGSEKVGALHTGVSWGKGRLQVEEFPNKLSAGYLVEENLCIKADGLVNEWVQISKA